MKSKLLVALAVILLSLFTNYSTCAAEQTGAEAELKDLVTKVEAKLKDGKKTEADLADELKAFDTVLAKHKDEKTDEVAQILFMKAMLYLQVLDNTDKGVAAIQQIKRDFPDTKSGKEADKILDSVKEQEEVRKISRSLVEGSKFPDFEEKDVADKKKRNLFFV